MVDACSVKVIVRLLMLDFGIGVGIWLEFYIEVEFVIGGR